MATCTEVIRNCDKTNVHLYSNYTNLTKNFTKGTKLGEGAQGSAYIYTQNGTSNKYIVKFSTIPEGVTENRVI